MSFNEFSDVLLTSDTNNLDYKALAIASMVLVLGGGVQLLAALFGG